MIDEEDAQAQGSRLKKRASFRKALFQFLNLPSIEGLFRTIFLTLIATPVVHTLLASILGPIVVSSITPRTPWEWDMFYLSEGPGFMFLDAGIGLFIVSFIAVGFSWRFGCLSFILSFVYVAVGIPSMNLQD